MTSAPPLLHRFDLADRSGGPWSADDIAAACAAVRGECGWHIAPVVEHDTLLVSGPAGSELVLPTGVGAGRPRVEVHAVHEVRTVGDTTSRHPVAGWRVGGAGILLRDGGWPRGKWNLEITLTHGYDACPADLVAVVVETAKMLSSDLIPGETTRQKTVGTVSRYRQFATDGPRWSIAARSIMDRYRA